MSHVNAKILDILKVNARSTISDIASTVGVSRTTAKEKIDRMLEQGVIRRFTVELGTDRPADARPEKAIFEIRLTKSACRSIYKEIREWPELVGCYSLAGDVDMIVILQARETARIEELREKLSRMPYVRTLQTRTILKRWDAAP